jgi:nitroreductase
MKSSHPPTPTGEAGLPRARKAGTSPTDHLASRYGGEIPSDRWPWNDVFDLLLAHRSVRAYRSDPLPEGTIESLLAAAQSASTSSNLQLWSVIAVEDRARKAALSGLAGSQRHILEAPLFLVFLADHARIRVAAEMEGLCTEGLDYLESFLVSAIDCALAAQNMTVAAESLGLGAVYIGGMRNHPEKVAEVVRLPRHAMALFGLCIGFPDSERAGSVKPRLPQSSVLHRETYAGPDEAELRRYNEILRMFQATVGMKQVDWTKFASARIGNPAALNGRDRLREAAANLGFQAR